MPCDIFEVTYLVYQVPIVVDQPPRLCTRRIALCHPREVVSVKEQARSLLVIEGQFHSRYNIMQSTGKVIWICLFPDPVSRCPFSKSACSRYQPEQTP